MIKINNIDKYFYKGTSKQIHVLDDVTLEFPDHGLVTILGKSGSGKTTLLNIIGGLDKAKGKINYDGFNIDKYSMSKMDAFRNKNIGYVFQNYMLINEATVYDNIDIALEIYGIENRKDREKRILAALDAVGMLNLRRRKAIALSGGQRQRVGIARAIAKAPNIIICDEPTGNLDSENTHEIMKILNDLSQTRLIILVTHNAPVAVEYSSRIINIADGKIIDDSSNKAIIVHLDNTLNTVNVHGISAKEVDEGNLHAQIISDSDKKINLKYIESNGKKYLFIDSDIEVNPKIDIVDKTPEIEKEESASLIKLDEALVGQTELKSISRKQIIKDSFVKFFRQKKKKTVFLNLLMAFMGIVIGTISITVNTSANYTSLDYFRSNYREDEVAVISNGSNGNGSSDIYTNDNLELGAYTLKLGEMYYGAYKDQEKSGLFDIDMGISGYVNSFTAIDSFVTQNTNNNTNSGFKVYPDSIYSSYNMVAGEMPKNAREVAIDSKIVDSMNKYMGNSPLSASQIIGTYYNGNYSLTSQVPLHLVISSGYSFKITGVFNSGYSMMVCKTNDYDELCSGGYQDYNYIEKEGISSFASISPSTKIVSLNKYDDSMINIIANNTAIQHLSKNVYSGSSNIFNITGTTSDPNIVFAYSKAGEESKRIGSNSLFYYNNANPLSLVRAIPDNLVVSSDGKKPDGFKQVVVSSTMTEENKSNLESIGAFDIVGTFDPVSPADELNIYSDSVYAHTIKMFGTNYLIANSSDGFILSISTKNVYFVSRDKNKTIAFANDFYNTTEYGISALDSYEKFVVTSRAANLSNSMSTIISYGLIGLFIVIILFFTTRSDMINHIYNIGVFRSLGAKRGYIFSVYSSDNIVRGLLTVCVGMIIPYLVCLFIISQGGAIAFPSWWIFLLTVVGILAIELLATLFALLSVLIKTPSELNSKYDI